VHSLGIIHRDLKPANILINDNCDTKIIDFGASRLFDSEAEMTPYVITRYYRAPEIIISWKHYTKAVDIWRFGCLFAELLTGHILFRGNDCMT